MHELDIAYMAKSGAEEIHLDVIHTIALARCSIRLFKGLSVNTARRS